jgi:hypothetical protein
MPATFVNNLFLYMKAGTFCCSNIVPRQQEIVIRWIEFWTAVINCDIIKKILCPSDVF